MSKTSPRGGYPVTWDQVKEFARQSPESRALVLEVLLLGKAKCAAKPQETKSRLLSEPRPSAGGSTRCGRKTLLAVLRWPEPAYLGKFEVEGEKNVRQRIRKRSLDFDEGVR